MLCGSLARLVEELDYDYVTGLANIWRGGIGLRKLILANFVLSASLDLK